MAFKTIKSDGGIVKPETLINPLIGVLVAKEQGTYSPIWVIRDDQDKIHKVRGCKDLDSKLAAVVMGTRVLLKYVKSVPTRAGNDMVIMLVQIDDGEDSDSSEGEDESSQQAEIPQEYTVGAIEFPEPEKRIATAEEIKLNPMARFGVFKKK